MAKMKINDISKWYAHEYPNECLAYITNKSKDDFRHGILTVIMIVFIIFLLNMEIFFLFLGTFSTTIYSKKK